MHVLTMVAICAHYIYAGITLYACIDIIYIYIYIYVTGFAKTYHLHTWVT